MIIGVLDFETTGLPVHPAAPLQLQPRAIELAVALLDRDQITHEAVWRFNPHQRIEPIITKITGITQAMLDDQPPFEASWPQMRAVLKQADAWLAHNASFDSWILECELQRAPQLQRINKPWICTLELFEPMWGKFPKLIELYKSVTGRQYAQTHRALDDVRALAEVVIAAQLWEVF